MSLFHRRSAFAVLAAVALIFAGAEAGDWQGTVEEVDGVETVRNPAEGMEGPVTVPLEELWRIGGYSEEEGEFFGVIARIAVDGEGNLYLLDSQLSEVKVFSPDGEYLRTLGREGEGPGEFRQAQDMFLLPDGNVAVLQLAPGRIVMLTPDGEPAGEFPLPEPEGGGTLALIRGHGMGEHVALVVSQNKLGEGKVDITRSLVLVDTAGKILARMLESTRVLAFVNFEFDETVWRTFDNRWSVGPNGNLYAVDDYLDYAVQVFSPQGKKTRVITREFEHWPRTDAQKQEMYDVFDALLQNQLPEYTIKVSEYDPDVTTVYPRDVGTLWVLTSRGSRELPEGALGTFDVFDPQGRFVREVTLKGEGTPFEDGYFFLGDRMYVVTDLLEANIASRGGRKGEESVEDPEPISVICYRLDADTVGF